MKQILNGVRGFGPYLLVELLLPGGSLIALLMWLFQRYSKRKTDLHAGKAGNVSAGRAAPALDAEGAGGLCRGACA